MRNKIQRKRALDEDRKKAALLKKRLGAAIKTARKKKHLSLVSLGTQVALDSGNLSRVENGHQWLGDLAFIRVSAALGVPIWLLLAAAEGAVEGRELEMLEIYQNSDGEGRVLIDQAVRVAKQHYQRAAGSSPPLRVMKHGTRQ